jgi:hypothetical protein
MGKQKRAFPIVNFFVRLVKGQKPWSDEFAIFFGGPPLLKFGEVDLRMSRSHEEERI